MSKRRLMTIGLIVLLFLIVGFFVAKQNNWLWFADQAFGESVDLDPPASTQEQAAKDFKQLKSHPPAATDSKEVQQRYYTDLAYNAGRIGDCATVESAYNSLDKYGVDETPLSKLIVIDCYQLHDGDAETVRRLLSEAKSQIDSIEDAEQRANYQRQYDMRAQL